MPQPSFQYRAHFIRNRFGLEPNAPLFGCWSLSSAAGKTGRKLIEGGANNKNKPKSL